MEPLSRPTLLHQVGSATLHVSNAPGTQGEVTSYVEDESVLPRGVWLLRQLLASGAGSLGKLSPG